jgi:hypothetical protein
MKSRTLLWIAFGVILFHIVGHTMGHFTWKQTDDTVLAGIINEMYSHQFEFMGKLQTVGGHHEGFSILFEITLLTFAALTWLMSRSVDVSSEMRKVLLVTGVALIACGIVEVIYFFALAGGSSLLAGLLHMIAYARAGRN